MCIVVEVLMLVCFRVLWNGVGLGLLMFSFLV